ncbi:hypothetical protein CRENBAI_009290 [Crenichthys baileyi]|uniref:Fibulin-2 domain-containing protein n=1 Tax=Crenichthys baileyi TaxID=28760 RepID=A0AAV9SIV4_9TELE
MAQAEVALLRWILLLLFLPVTLSQRDCSGVDCPLLENCIKEVLESGACCPSCLEKGCKCEGYEKYDCSRAGFNNSIVPEGESYFVDYGSTECSCPVGGGPISCRYISCPDMPPNCIEILEPQDSCQQCERIGCVHDGEKYEAGHSFHIEACRVCHCPNEGGQLMCYPVPNCNPQNVHNHNSMLTFPTDDNTFNGRDSYSTRFDQGFASYHRPSSGNLPLFKTSPSDNDDSEEYDYSPADISETYPDLFVQPTQSSISSNKVVSIGSERPDRTSSLLGLNVQEKMELREQHRVHYHLADKEEVTKVSLTAEQSTAMSLPPSTPRLTESLPGRDPLHSPGREDLKVEGKKGEEEAYSPVLLFRPEGACLTGRHNGGAYLERQKLAGELYLHTMIQEGQKIHIAIKDPADTRRR